MKKSRLPSLASLLFEDIGDDIQAAAKDGPAAVRTLANSAKDKEALKNALKGSYDKKPDDDTVSVAEGAIVAVNSLLPTQKEIDLVQSVGWPMCDLNTLVKMIKTKMSTAPGSITVSGNLIIDGHHRWSSTWSIAGADGKISVDDIALPGNTQAEKLAAAQLAIAAYKPATAQQPAAADPIELNILGASPEKVAEMLIKAGQEGRKDPNAPAPVMNPPFLEGCAKDPTVAGWAGFEVGADVETVKQALAKKVGSNLATLPKNDEAPARADMPQLDAETIGGKQAKADIKAGLKSGEFNVSPPFKPTESVSNSDKVIMERWQRLAGIIKD